ncbi:MAG: dephospho-CoA kinase [Actinobacteria bacterium]|nr:dephospho-CoA kinase [Actinomycetota bacterium]
MTAHALLSGGIGSGKSTASAVFVSLGAAVVSADAAGHLVLAPGGEAEAAVAARWPEAVVGGVIDRGALGRLVFSEPGGLLELEAITHPAIARVVASEVEAAGEAPLILVEVPLPIDVLGEGWPRIVVDAPEDLRIFRLRLRGMEPEEIAGRMAVQPRRGEWLALADHVIDNSGGPDELAAECRRVWTALVGRPPG